MVQKERRRAGQSHGGAQGKSGQVQSGIVREVYRLLLASKQAAGLPKPGAIDLIPFGFDAVRPSLELMSAYAFEMKLTPRRYSFEELFDDTTRALRA